MLNGRDQEIVNSAIADTGAGLLEFLTALGQREAIAFGDGITRPARIRFDDLPKYRPPRSSTARFSAKMVESRWVMRGSWSSTVGAMPRRPRVPKPTR
jgi:hypothetical protein